MLFAVPSVFGLSQYAENLAQEHLWQLVSHVVRFNQYCSDVAKAIQMKGGYEHRNHPCITFSIWMKETPSHLNIFVTHSELSQSQEKDGVITKFSMWERDGEMFVDYSDENDTTREYVMALWAAFLSETDPQITALSML